MKTQRTLIATLALSLAMPVGLAFAGPKEGPCRKIREACEAGGFHQGDHKKNGKGLFVDCMKKIKNGESVPGVTVSPEVVAACKERKAKHHAEGSNVSNAAGSAAAPTTPPSH